MWIPRVRAVHGVSLRDLDGLQRQAARGLAERAGAVVRAEKILEDALAVHTRDEQMSEAATSTIIALRARFHGVMGSELDRVFARSLRHLPEEDRAAVRATLGRVVNKLLHAPTLALRGAIEDDGANTVIDAARDLFGLDGVSLDRER
jgi:glutamyl-tRNA reductase